jgi:hypothetical protein
MEVRVVYWCQYPEGAVPAGAVVEYSCVLSRRTAIVSTSDPLAGERSRRQLRFPDRLVQFQ